MKLFIVTLLFCFVTLLSYSQQFKSTISGEFENSKNWVKMIKTENGFIGYDEVGSRDHLMYGFGWNKVRLGLDVVLYDSSMKEVKRASLADKERVFGPFMTDMKKIGNKIYIMYHEIQEKNTIGNIMAMEINPVTLESGKPITIGKVSGSETKLKFSENLQSYFRYFISKSPDNTKNVFLMSDGQHQYFMSVFDENMNNLWNRSGENTDYLFDFVSVCIDNAGNIYAGMHHNNNKVDETNTESRVLVFHAKGNPVVLNLQVKGGAVTTFKLLPSAKENIIHFAGFYAAVPKFFNGVFEGKISCDNFRISSTKNYLFPDSVLSIFEKDGIAVTKKKEYGLSSSMVPDLFEMEDGTADLVAELQEIRQSPKWVYNITGDILNVHFSKTGTYYSRIPKYRTSAESTIGNSYHAFPYKDKMIIFYDENEKNLENDISAKPLSSNVYKNLVLAAGVIDSKGTVKRQLLFNLTDEHYLGLTERMIEMSHNTLQIPLIKIKALGGISEKTRLATIEIID